MTMSINIPIRMPNIHLFYPPTLLIPRPAEQDVTWQSCRLLRNMRTRRKQCYNISSVYRVIYRAKVPTNWPIKSPDREHIDRKWTSTPPPLTTLKKLSVDLRAKIHKYRGQIYGTKCKCDVLLFVKLEYNICGIYPPPKLLSKPRQTLVFKHHLKNDIFFYNNSTEYFSDSI